MEVYFTCVMVFLTNVHLYYLFDTEHDLNTFFYRLTKLEAETGFLNNPSSKHALFVFLSSADEVGYVKVLYAVCTYFE